MTRPRRAGGSRGTVVCTVLVPQLMSQLPTALRASSAAALIGRLGLNLPYSLHQNLHAVLQVSAGKAARYPARLCIAEHGAKLRLSFAQSEL